VVDATRATTRYSMPKGMTSPEEHSMNSPRTPYTPLIAALVAAFALAACGRNDDSMTAGQKVDDTVAKVEQNAAEAKADMNRSADQAKSSVQEAAQDAKQAAANAGDKVAGAVSDAAITTTINAELAKDDKLSALKINVDTAQGRVALRGTAPDADAKERATRIAAGVEGVMSVDNLLTIEAKS
jgi:hyperosmotically inducible protein